MSSRRAKGSTPRNPYKQAYKSTKSSDRAQSSNNNTEEFLDDSVLSDLMDKVERQFESNQRLEKARKLFKNSDGCAVVPRQLELETQDMHNSAMTLPQQSTHTQKTNAVMTPNILARCESVPQKLKFETQELESVGITLPQEKNNTEKTGIVMTPGISHRDNSLTTMTQSTYKPKEAELAIARTPIYLHERNDDKRTPVRNPYMKIADVHRQRTNLPTASDSPPFHQRLGFDLHPGMTSRSKSQSLATTLSMESTTSSNMLAIPENVAFYPESDNPTPIRNPYLKRKTNPVAACTPQKISPSIDITTPIRNPYLKQRSNHGTNSIENSKRIAARSRLLPINLEHEFDIEDSLDDSVLLELMEKVETQQKEIKARHTGYQNTLCAIPSHSTLKPRRLEFGSRNEQVENAGGPPETLTLMIKKEWQGQGPDSFSALHNMVKQRRILEDYVNGEYLDLLKEGTAHVQPQPNPRDTLCHRINFLQLNGDFTETFIGSMHTIRDLGNKAKHNDEHLPPRIILERAITEYQTEMEAYNNRS